MNKFTKNYIKRGIILYSSFFLFFISCKKSNEIEIGKNKYYKLEDKEISLVLTKYVQTDYELFINNLQLELPLNRYLKSKSISTFVGVSLSDNINLINKKIANDSSSKIIDKKNVNQMIVFFSKKQNYFYQIVAIQDEFPLVIISSSKDSSIIRSSYNENKLLSKVY